MIIQFSYLYTIAILICSMFRDDFVKMRHVLQRGIEVVRLIGSHGLSVSMVTYLARCFDIKVSLFSIALRVLGNDYDSFPSCFSVFPSLNA